MEKRMLVDGMKCMHCKASVEKALAAVPGVSSAEVILNEKTAVIRMDTEVDNQALMDAVRAKGFEPVRMF